MTNGKLNSALYNDFINMNESNDDQKFRITIEQLDYCKRLILAGSEINARISLILLDNLADLLMYRRCNGEFSRDKDWSKFMRPRTTIYERKQALGYFYPKVKILKRLKFLTSYDADALKICHSYRNAVYHRDTHNPRTIIALTRVFFKTVCGIFKNYYQSGITSYNNPSSWGGRYGLNLNYIDFGKDSKKIYNQFVKGIQISFPKAKEILIKDIEYRLNLIKETRDNNDYLINDVILSSRFVVYQFEDLFPEEGLFKELNELHYRITKKYKPNRKEYIEIKKKCENRYKRKFKKFLKEKPIIYSKELKRIESTNLLKNTSSINQLLNRYQALDEVLSKIEVYIERAERDFDYDVQLEIDIRRGK